MKENKTRNISMIVFSIFIYLAILAVVGMFQIFIFDTDLSVVKTPEFWIEQVITSLMYFAAYIATALLRYSILELNEKEFNDMESMIKKNRPKLIGNDFRFHIDKLDFRNKRDTWKNKIQIKLSNHSRKITKKIAAQVANVPEAEWGFWTKRFIKKERRLQDYLSEAWISKNLKFHPLRYPEITVSEIINGTLRMKTNGSMINRRHLSKQIMHKLAWVFGSIVASAVWAILIFQEVLNPLDVIAKIIFTLFMLFLNIIIGYFAAGLAHKSRIIATTERLEIILDFIGTKKEISES